MRSLSAVVLASSALVACGGAPHPRAEHGDAHHDATSTDALASRLAEIARSLRPAGLASRGELARGFLSGGEPATFAVEIPARQCSAFVSLASPGLHDLDATLFAPDGTELASDTEPDAHPTVVACAEDTPRRAYVHLRAYSGAGAFALAAFDGEDRALPALARIVGGRPAVAAAEGAASEDAARVREFVLGVGRRGFEARGDPSDVRLADGQHVRVPLPVDANACVTVGAFATGRLANVDLRILDEEGHELARDVAATRDASTQACSDRAADWTAEVVAVAGSGDARVQVLSGPQTRTGGPGSLWLGERTDALAASAPAPAVAPGAAWSVRGTLVSGEATEHALPAVPATGCLAVRATPGRGIVRLGLLLRDGRRARVASSEGPGGGAPTVVHVCGPVAAPLTLVVAARGGGGEYAAEARTTGAPAEAPAPLRAALLDADADAAGAGLTRESAAGPARDASLTVAPGECVRVVRLARATVAAHVSLEESGRVVSAATGLSPRASVCATDQPRVVALRADDGAGSLVVVYRGAHSAVAAPAGAP